MASLLQGFFRRVIHIQVTGTIDVKQANRIYSHLEKCHKYSVPGIVVTINSKGGCLTQAKNISAAITQFSHKKVAPVYCFAEDMCLNSANVILTGGKDCYASRMSLMGDFGYYSATVGVKGLLKDWKVGFQVMRAGVNKATMNPLEDLPERDEKWMQNYLYSVEHELRSTIVKNRINQLQRHNMTKQTIESQIFEKGAVDPQEAIESGLIDGINTVDQFLAQKFQGVKIKKINPPRPEMARVFDIKDIIEDL